MSDVDRPDEPGLGMPVSSEAPKPETTRERRERVSREVEIPERFLRLACATVFPNGEREYGDERVVAEARRLMKAEG